jgi:hypothetical protein
MPDTAPTIWPCEPIWHHETLRGWAVLLRQWGYRGRLPTWAIRRCYAHWPMEFCQCHLYRLQWAQASWQGEHRGEDEKQVR